MRKRISVIAVAVCVMLLSLLSSCAQKPSDDLSSQLSRCSITGVEAVAPVGELTEEMRGVWIASVYNINFPSAPDLSEDQLKSELEDIVKTVMESNMNTVFLQVHPASDALYKSKLFPVSEFLYSDGVLHFDPLEYMTEICRENGIALYAWLNPLRVSTSATDSKDEAKAALPEGSPGMDDSLTTYYGDGKLYLNCGKEAVRNLISDAVYEIVSQYDVDGVVFDDYFYPYPVYDISGEMCVFDDAADHEASGTSLSLEDWRRDNVNQMVKACYERIKETDRDVIFGVAPFGIWQNDDGTGVGSATSGMEAYSELFCDATAWIKGGYIDFISPQLYWECSSTAAPFGELVRFWDSLTDGTDVDLVISHGLYRYDNDWESPEGELMRQVSLARDSISYTGSMLYGYAALKKDACGAAGDTEKSFSSSVYYYDPPATNEGVMIDIEADAHISGSYVIFSGYSDTSYPLTVNGQKVSRSKGGYFECELLLKYGKNDFVFVCGEYNTTVSVFKNQ